MILTGREREQNSLLGIGITNNTHQEHSIDILGQQMFRLKPEGITLTNLCGEAYIDDNNLALFQNMINIKPFYITVTRIKDSMFMNSNLIKEFHVKQIHNNGSQSIKRLVTRSYFDPKGFNAGLVDIPIKYRLCNETEFHLVIPPYTCNVINFFLDGKTEQYGEIKSYEKAISDKYEMYDEEKKKKFLFIM